MPVKLRTLTAGAGAFLFCCTGGLVAQPAAPAVPVPAVAAPGLAGFEAHVERSMAQWGVAGAAIGIVHNGELVFLKGFGVRNSRTRDPVDGDTVFAIGSITKSFTAVLAGLLADDGKLSFDDRLVQHVPGFAVSDPYATGAATLRDALSHRTGYDWRMDALLFSSGDTRQEVIAAMRRAEPSFPFRAQYGYSNIMYLVAGEAIGAAGGDVWERLVARRIFEPLGMTRSSTGSASLGTLPNLAAPHRNSGEGPRPIARRDTSLIGGAGAINSSARDMTRFIQMMATGGKIGERQFLSNSSFEELLAPHANVGVQQELRPFTNFHAYGLGWEVLDYKGRKVALHGGAIDGFLAEMAVIPGSGFGVVVLTNTDGVRNLPSALILNVLDRFLGGAQTDWNAGQLKRGLAFREMLLGVPARIAGTRPTLPLTAYAGEYRGPNGAVRIRAAGERLFATIGGRESELEHWHHDTFRGPWNLFGERLATFGLDHGGKPERLTVEFVGEFRRVPAFR